MGMNPTKMVNVAEEIVLDFEGGKGNMDIPLSKKQARDLVKEDADQSRLKVEFRDKQLETLVISKGDGQAKVDPNAEKAKGNGAASKKKAAASTGQSASK